MRMMSGLLAAQQGSFTLTGDASLSRRPMERIRKPLEAMGARLTLTEGHAPLTIEGGPLKAIDYTTPVPSAQVKTCILLAGLQTAGTTTVREAVRTRDHSELALRAFGARITRTLDSVSDGGAAGAAAQLTPRCPATSPPPRFSCAPPRSSPAPGW